MKNTNFDQVDILHHAEKFAETASNKMNWKSRETFKRYPIFFTLLVVFGIIAIDEGAKGIFENIGFANHPIYLLITGIVILVITGTLFKKLSGFHVEK
jgi:fumarate reductase subunit C